jgi:hypothetical protein
VKKRVLDISQNIWAGKELGIIYKLFVPKVK